MAARQLSGWHIVTIIVACFAIVAMAAVALILGKDAIIAMAAIFFCAIILVSWFVYM